MVTKPASEQSQDFSIHNEDFPALPGSSYKDPTSSNDDSKSVSNWELYMWVIEFFFPSDFSYINNFVDYIKDLLNTVTKLFILNICKNLTSEECGKPL